MTCEAPFRLIPLPIVRIFWNSRCPLPFCVNDSIFILNSLVINGKKPKTKFMFIKATTFSFCPCCTFISNYALWRDFIPGRRGCSVTVLTRLWNIFILTFLQVVSVDLLYLLSLKSKQFQSGWPRFWLEQSQVSRKVSYRKWGVMMPESMCPWLLGRGLGTVGRKLVENSIMNLVAVLSHPSVGIRK